MDHWMINDAADSVKTVMDEVNTSVPASRERSLALTKLEEAEMWLRRLSDRTDPAKIEHN